MQATMERKVSEAPELTARQGTEIVMMLGNPALPASMRAAISRVVNMRVTGVGIKPGKGISSAAPQSCLTIENYGNRKFWEVLCNPRSDPSRVLAMVAYTMERMGLVHADNGTWIAATATIIAANAQATSNQLEFNPNDAYMLLQKLKKHVRCITKKVHLPHYGEVKVFPTTPDLLRDGFEHVYDLVYPDSVRFPINAPEPCPLNLMILTSLKTRLPGRCTHGSLAGTPTLFPKPRRNAPAIEDHGIDLPGFRWNSFRPQSKAVASPSQAEVEVMQRALLAMPSSEVGPPQLTDIGQAGQDTEQRQTNEGESFGAAPSIHALAANIQHAAARNDIGSNSSKSQQKALTEALHTPEKKTTTKKRKTPPKRPAATPALKRPAAAAAPKKPAKKQKLQKPPFPGKPRKPADPVNAGEYIIYTDVASQGWRARKRGERKDKSFSFKIDAEEAWDRLWNFIKES